MDQDARITAMLSDGEALGRIADHVATTRERECQAALVLLMKHGSGAELRSLLVEGARDLIEARDSDAEFIEGGEYVRRPLTDSRVLQLRVAGFL